MAAKPSLKNLISLLAKTRRELDMCTRRLDIILADLLEYDGGDPGKSRQAKKQKRRTSK
jgi:hypothetical protein